MRWAENYWAFSGGAKFAYAFESFLIDDDLVIDGGEDELHDLRHPFERCVAVVGGDHIDVFDRLLLHFTVYFIFLDIQMKRATVVLQLRFH